MFGNGKHFIIKLVVPKGEPRVCDYCNCFLVDENAYVVDECFTTDYGLMCNRCIGRIRSLKGYMKGDNVYYEGWY